MPSWMTAACATCLLSKARNREAAAGMKVDDQPFRTIWLADDGWAVEIIDQTKLPFAFVTVRMESLDDAGRAIHDMEVRGAPLIGATAAYGMALAMHGDPSDENLKAAAKALIQTRPTAVNLSWAVAEMIMLLEPLSPNARPEAAYKRAAEICDDLDADDRVRLSNLSHGQRFPTRPRSGRRS